MAFACCLPFFRSVAPPEPPLRSKNPITADYGNPFTAVLPFGHVEDTHYNGSPSKTPGSHTPHLPFVPGLRSPPPPLPVEVCEFIIDELGMQYDPCGPYFWTPTSRALQRCALVCRAWRARAQFWLFHMMGLRTQNGAEFLRRLVVLLDDVPYLAKHVQRISLGSGSGNAAAALFPALIGRRLPSLREVTVDGCEKSASGARDASPLFLPSRLNSSTFSAVTTLRLNDVTTYTFSHFAEFLRAFPSLEALSCKGVRWLALGPLPGWLMSKASSRDEVFLANLRSLEVSEMEYHGVERIINVLPSDTLNQLSVEYPLYHPCSDIAMEDPITGRRVGPNLSHLKSLERIELHAAVDVIFEIANGTDSQALHAALASWNPNIFLRHIALDITGVDLACRDVVLDFLRPIGNVIETSHSGDLPPFVSVRLHDVALASSWGDEEAREHIERLFPTAASQNKLDIATSYTSPVKMSAPLAISRDAKWAASGTEDQWAISLWDVTKTLPAPHRTWSARGNSVDSLVFSPDNTLLASAGVQVKIRLWNVPDGTLNATLTGHSDTITNLAWSPDGRWLASSSLDKTMRVWDIKSKSSRSCESRVLLHGSTQGILLVRFSPDGRWLVACNQGYTSRVWDVRSRSADPYELRGPPRSNLSAVAFDSTSTRIATGSRQGTVEVWSITSGPQKLFSTRAHSSLVTTLCFSNDGMDLLSASRDGTARVWNAYKYGKPFLSLNGHRNRVTSAVFSPDGQHIVTASLDKTARVWRRCDGRSVVDFVDHDGGVLNVAFTPDGSTLLSCTDDGRVHVRHSWKDYW